MIQARIDQGLNALEKASRHHLEVVLNAIQEVAGENLAFLNGERQSFSETLRLEGHGQMADAHRIIIEQIRQIESFGDAVPNWHMPTLAENVNLLANTPHNIQAIKKWREEYADVLKVLEEGIAPKAVATSAAHTKESSPESFLTQILKALGIKGRQ